MKRHTRLVLFTLLMIAPLSAVPAAAAVYTAASCNRSDVNAIINGPTHIAVDGDTISIPSGSCTWTSGITVPAGKAITVTGLGTPDASAGMAGASPSCTSTTITLSGATGFSMTPSNGTSITRLSCMKLIYGGGASIGFKILGTCSVSGCPNVRIDNLTFTNWAGHALNGISYGINAIGDVFGVIDHNTVDGLAANYLHLVEFSHARYFGVGAYGDNAWAQPEDYGSEKFLFIENNRFNTAGCCENEGMAGADQTTQGGGRVVVRFNTFANMDNYNFAMGWHGTESNGRPRGTRAFEFYGNTFLCKVHCDSVAGARSGTGLVWGNTIDLTAGSLTGFFTLTTYRAEGNSGGWGACDGSSMYDTNDGTTYWSGTVSSGGGTTTLTVSGSSPGWLPNQWAPNGAPFSVHDVTKNTGSEITANGDNTLTLASSGGPGSWLPANGDTIQILRATACLDQGGGRGAGILYSAPTASPVTSAAQVISPTYVWSNTFIGGAPSFNSNTGISVNTRRVIRSRDFYVENLNQPAQFTAMSPFDGATTIGIGHGTLVNRPTTCTPGVGYWATDQGSWNTTGSGGQGRLYLCRATNTWVVSYTPYAYPHPLISGVAVIRSPSPPMNVQIIRD